MKYTSLIFLALGLFWRTSFAQKVSYEVLKDDPAFNDISIMPYLSVYSSMEQTLGAINGGVEAYIRKLPVHIRGHYDYALLNASIINKAYEAPITFEVGGEFPLVTRKVTKTKNFPLKSTGYSVVTTTYLRMPHNFEKMILVRGGFMHYTGNFSYEQAEFNSTPSDFTVNSNYSSSGIYLGLSTLGRSGMQLQASSPEEDYGTRRSLRYFQFYADLLINMTMDMGEFEDNGNWGSPGTNYNIKNESTLGSSTMGLRIGTYFLINNKSRNHNGTYIKCEVGTRPSPDDENLWLMVAYGIMLNAGN